MTRNDKIEVAVVQQEVDARGKDSHCFIRRNRWLKRAVAGHTAIEVEVASDEVTEKREYHRGDGRVLRFEVAKVESHFEKLCGSFLCDVERILVEVVHLARANGLLDVPVGRHDNTRCLTTTSGKNRGNGERLGWSCERDECIVLHVETCDFFLKRLVLLVGLLLGLLETAFLQVVLDLLVCGNRLVAFFLQTERLGVLFDGTRFNLQLLCDSIHTVSPMALGVDSEARGTARTWHPFSCVGRMLFALHIVLLS